MELLHVALFERRIQEKRSDQQRGNRRVSDELLREHIDRYRRAGDRQNLEREKTLRFGKESIERCEEQENERRVVTEEFSTHDRDERCVKVRHEPEALIEDGQVERRIPVAVVHLPTEVTEPTNVEREEHDERPRFSGEPIRTGFEGPVRRREPQRRCDVGTRSRYPVR